MRQIALKAILFGLTFNTIACCSIADRLTGGRDMKAVAELWSDVPRMDGITKSEGEMPAGLRLLVRPVLGGMMRGLNDGKDAGDWDVAFYTVTGKTPKDVKDFYAPARMATYGWEQKGNSACMNLSGERAIMCAFTKRAGNKDVGLAIISAADDQGQQTSIFFLRNEATPPATDKQPAAAASRQPTRGAITKLSGPAPYGIEKRPMPTGLNVDQLLPKQVGAYTRERVELSSDRSVQPSTAQMDGNSVYATYRAGANEIFVESAVSSSAENAQMALDVAAGDVTGRFPTDPRLGSIGTEPSYLKVTNGDGAFFAWTRGGYYYSAHAKSGEPALDAFMQAFPY